MTTPPPRLSPSDEFIVFDNNGAFRFTRQAVGAPAVQSGAAVNAGSFTAQISPGSLFSLYGSNLASSSTATIAPSSKIRTAASTVRTPQINFQVPELAAGDYPLTVTADGVPSNSPLFRIGNP